MLAAGRASASERRRRRRSAYRRRRRGFLRGRSRRRGNFQPLKASPGESGPARRQGRRRGGEGGRDGGRPGTAQLGSARLGWAGRNSLRPPCPALPCPRRGSTRSPAGGRRRPAAPGASPRGPCPLQAAPRLLSPPPEAERGLGGAGGELGLWCGAAVCQSLERVTVVLIIYEGG